ncbi:MAG: hypothetical protein KAI66_28255 [Lentisphaeria bacterium]|nr:hypothetical protein [Lentisphaeria bacterium]
MKYLLVGLGLLALVSGGLVALSQQSESGDLGVLAGLRGGEVLPDKVCDTNGGGSVKGTCTGIVQHSDGCADIGAGLWQCDPCPWGPSEHHPCAYGTCDEDPSLTFVLCGEDPTEECPQWTLNCGFAEGGECTYSVSTRPTEPPGACGPLGIQQYKCDGGPCVSNPDTVFPCKIVQCSNPN